MARISGSILESVYKGKGQEMTKRSRRSNGIIAVLADRPIAYHPALAKPLKGVREAIFVCQLLYWDGKGKTPGGWIYKTQAEWQEETGLRRFEQETVRKHLKKLKVLEEQKKGVPARLYYRLNFDVLYELVEQAYPEAENPSMLESSIQGCGDPAHKHVAIQQSISESTIQRKGVSNGLSSLWKTALDELSQQMTKQTYDQWLAGSLLLHCEDGHAIIAVQTEYQVDWLANRLITPIKRTLSAIADMPDLRVTIQAQPALF
jgi:hypothetical protein